METGVLKTKSKVFFSSLLAAVVLLLALLWGSANGKATAQSITVSSIAQNLIPGLQYFYSDQGRFPTALEFSDQTIMLNYFSSFPPANYVSKTCSQSFAYRRITADNFQLSFCLEKAVQGYQAGWNSLSGNPPQANPAQH